jgi:hypothetical protein
MVHSCLKELFLLVLNNVCHFRIIYHRLNVLVLFLVPMPGGPSPSNYQQSRSFPSLQSILSLAGFQSGSPSSPSPFNPQQSLSPSPFNPQQSLSPSNFFNNGPYGGDSLGSMLGDYQSRPYNNDYRQSNDYRQPSSRYAPSTRSSTETQSTANARATNEARPAATRSSVVRA